MMVVRLGSALIEKTGSSINKDMGLGQQGFVSIGHVL